MNRPSGRTPSGQVVDTPDDVTDGGTDEEIVTQAWGIIDTDEPATATHALDDRTTTAAPSTTPDTPAGVRPARWTRMRSSLAGPLRALLERPVRTAAVAVVVGLLAVAGAVGMQVEAGSLTGPASNTALTDPQATGQVISEINAAVQRTYGYSYDALDADERAAQDVVTGTFADRYRQEFATVRNLAPQQRAVVTATVLSSAVRELDGDHAEVLVFVDQKITNTQVPNGAGNGARLVVTAQKVDGHWRIADASNQ